MSQPTPVRFAVPGVVRSSPDNRQLWLHLGDTQGGHRMLPLPLVQPITYVDIEKNPPDITWDFHGPGTDMRLIASADYAAVVSLDSKTGAWRLIWRQPSKGSRRICDLNVELRPRERGGLLADKTLPLTASLFGQQLRVGENGFQITVKSNVLAEWRRDLGQPGITVGAAALATTPPMTPDNLCSWSVSVNVRASEDRRGLFVEYANAMLWEPRRGVVESENSDILFRWAGRDNPLELLITSRHTGGSSEVQSWDRLHYERRIRLGEAVLICEISTRSTRRHHPEHEFRSETERWRLELANGDWVILHEDSRSAK